MKAAIIIQKGDMPQYVDNFAEPKVQQENELLITVKAAAIKHLDKSRASGTHYSTKNDMSQAKVIGGDGVGLLEDGTRVFALGISGMIAEKAIIDKRRMVKLPEGIDAVIAAALPNAVAGSAMALRFRAGIGSGETILTTGVTSFTGKIAIQVAKHYRAKKIIVTGRNEQTLKSLLSLGADETVCIKEGAVDFSEKIKNIHASTPIDIVIDYLWGQTAELILDAIKGEVDFF